MNLTICKTSKQSRGESHAGTTRLESAHDDDDERERPGQDNARDPTTYLLAIKGLDGTLNEELLSRPVHGRPRDHERPGVRDSAVGGLVEFGEDGELDGLRGERGRHRRDRRHARGGGQDRSEVTNRLGTGAEG